MSLERAGPLDVTEDFMCMRHLCYGVRPGAPFNVCMNGRVYVANYTPYPTGTSIR